MHLHYGLYLLLYYTESGILVMANIPDPWRCVMDAQVCLTEFPKYLEEHRLAQARHIPFLVRWVRDYLGTAPDVSLLPDDRLRTRPTPSPRIWTGRDGLPSTAGCVRQQRWQRVTSNAI